MTLHKSLKTTGSLKRARNVLTRAERIGMLTEDGRWDESKSVFGLPKVRQYVMKRRHTKAAKKEEVAGAEGAAPVEGAAEAAPAKGAAAGKAAAGKAPAGKAAPAAAKSAAPAKGAKGK
jgi:small basic protein (TIGR04137 family)